MHPLIQTHDLIFAYNRPGQNALDAPPPNYVLRGLNITIAPGSFVAIVGANGSGKSTFSKLLNGILLPTGGKVYVEGMDTVDEALLIEIRRRVGLVFQNPDNQIVSNIVEDDVAFAPENLGVAPAEIRERVDEALKAVGLYDLRKHAPHLLSGGQKQRLAIAGIIAMRPRCIVLDEPTAMLDPAGRREVHETIRNLRETHGIAVVLITHHMAECIDADRLVVMAEGEIVLDDTPAQVFIQVERLQSLGLTVPTTTALLHALREEGLPVSLDALSIDACAAEIVKSL
ncbi:MAG: energy-coupling factor transporter ATPase [Oscillospiraceae bacterium]|nr:energy-coupling factor transporter ATPase [Oscillospiraceae bacterium]